MIERIQNIRKLVNLVEIQRNYVLNVTKNNNINKFNSLVSKSNSGKPTLNLNKVVVNL